MTLQPSTDRGLHETGTRQASTGVKLLALGVVLAVLGAVLLIAAGATFLGLACIALATPPTVAGIALLASGGVSRREAKHKDWA